MSDQLRNFITRQLAGESAPIADNIPFDGDDPRYRAALAAEVAAEADDGEAERPAAAGYDPGKLPRFTADAAAAMGFEPRSEEPATAQERFFEAIGEVGQDTLYAAWLAGLSAEDRAGVLAGDSSAVDSFEKYVQESSLSTAATIADGIPGARLIRDPLHRPLRRFRR